MAEAKVQEFLGTGRRKTAVARVRMAAGSGKITVNNRPFENYFPIENALALASPDDLFALEYEDLGRLSVVRELLQFLRLPAAVIGRTLERGTSSDDELRFSRGPTAAERIQNYGEIQQFLRTTRYRRWVGA